MNLTVFSGTFNPIHIAHLIIAEQVRTTLGLNKILFIPANIPPHRDKHLADSADRFNMVKLAIEGNPFFEISDIELRSEGKSYSYLTIKKLYKQNPNISDKINFIIGSDAFKLIDSWYKAESLARIVNFIIVSRPDCDNVNKIFSNIRLKDFSYQIVKIPQMDISSTLIRKNISDKKSIKYLVTEPVEKYIYDNNLYENLEE